MFVIAGNWKMYKTPQETQKYIKEFLPLLTRGQDRRFLIFPPATNLDSALAATQDTPLEVGAQNCHFQNEGAFTGETSPRTLSQMGVRVVLVGHSERRTLFKEADDVLAKKVKAIQDLGMTPLLCLGESLADREAGNTQRVIEKQLHEGLRLADTGSRLMIAYEPVWAIGTGKVATPQQAEDAHSFLRGVLQNIGGIEFAQQTRILYGGSVKPSNAQELASQKNINGFLVGGASLEPAEFAQIANVSIM